MNGSMRLVCWFRGHLWDSVHGYEDKPNFGAICQRCFTQYMTRDEWKARSNLPEDY